MRYENTKKGLKNSVVANRILVFISVHYVDNINNHKIIGFFFAVALSACNYNNAMAQMKLLAPCFQRENMRCDIAFCRHHT